MPSFKTSIAPLEAFVSVKSLFLIDKGTVTFNMNTTVFGIYNNITKYHVETTTKN